MISSFSGTIQFNPRRIEYLEVLNPSWHHGATNPNKLQITGLRSLVQAVLCEVALHHWMVTGALLQHPPWQTLYLGDGANNVTLILSTWRLVDHPPTTGSYTTTLHYHYTITTATGSYKAYGPIILSYPWPGRSILAASAMAFAFLGDLFAARAALCAPEYSLDQHKLKNKKD